MAVQAGTWCTQLIAITFLQATEGVAQVKAVAELR